MREYLQGESGVSNVKRLVQNITDQYPFEPQIAAIVELIANSLDAKASGIKIKIDQREGILEVEDDGIGMDKRQFKEYHDFAATSKVRGKGIGFAGQGAKLALNFCKKVVTETWSSNYKGYSEWFLKGNKAPYTIFTGKGLNLSQFGTKVTFYLKEKNKDFYNKKNITETLVEHYFPLIDKKLRELYKEEYKDGVRIFMNEKEVVIEPSILDILEKRKDIPIIFQRKLKAIGIIGVIKNFPYLIIPGVMLCTYGKVIERSYFKKEPINKEEIIGWIEAPYLIEAVTTDKCRFQGGNKTWEGFFRKVQREFTKWLQDTDLLEKPSKRELNYTNLEKEINSIIKNLPEFSFFGSRIQRDVAIPDINGEKKQMEEGTPKNPGTIRGETSGEGVSVHPGEELWESPTLKPGKDIGATSKPRTVRSGIRIAEKERPDLDNEAYFDGETVFINKSHPAYKKAKTIRLLNYHLIKATVLELVKFCVEKEPEASYQRVFELQQKFFKVWGEQ